MWSPDGTQVAVHAWEGHDEWFVFDPRDPANPAAVGEECPFPRRNPEEERERISEARMEGRGFDKYTSYYGPYAPDAVSRDGELYATTGGRAIFLLDLVKGRNRKMAEDESWARWAELAFSPDKDWLVSVQHGSATAEGSDDRVEEVMLTVWEVSTGRKLAREYLRGDPAELREVLERLLHDRVLHRVHLEVPQRDVEPDHPRTPDPPDRALAQSRRSDRLRFGQCGLILPDWHPIRLAEDIATFDHMTRGRVDIGIAPGINSRACKNFHPAGDRQRRVL